MKIIFLRVAIWNLVWWNKNLKTRGRTRHPILDYSSTTLMFLKAVYTPRTAYGRRLTEHEGIKKMLGQKLV